MLIRQVQEDSISHAHLMRPLPVRHHLPQPKLSKLLSGSVLRRGGLLVLAIHTVRETPTDCPWLYNHTSSPQLKLQDNHPGDQASLLWTVQKLSSFTVLISMDIHWKSWRGWFWLGILSWDLLIISHLQKASSPAINSLTKPWNWP